MKTRDFLLLNLLVLLLNAGVGVYFNIGSLLLRKTANERYIRLERSRNRLNSNDSNCEVELFPADNVAKELGIKDATGNFTSHPFHWPSQGWVDISSNSQTCMATQTSVDRLFWLSWQAEAWSGPLSVAIYAPGSDLGVAVAMINYLRKCFPGILERTTLHLTYPTNRPPYIAGRQEDYSSLDCDTPETVNKQLLKLRDSDHVLDHIYPQNLLRNIARRTCSTKWSFTIDVDMLVVPAMAESLEAFFSTSSDCQKCGFVIPVYEISKKVEYPPDDKDHLLKLIKDNLARRYHSTVYSKNQGNSHLERWEFPDVNTSAPDDVPLYQIMYNITTYEEFWEPPLILPESAPGFDERFIGYGYTRSSQVYELYIRGYTFKVLNKAFLAHRGFQTTTNYPKFRIAQIEHNRNLYQVFKKELHAKFNLEPPKPLAPPGARPFPHRGRKHTPNNSKKSQLHLVNPKIGSLVSLRKLPPVLSNLVD